MMNSKEDIKEIIWPDGPSSEFKNMSNVEILRRLAEKHNKKSIWKSFATSQGKGAVDAI